MTLYRPFFISGSRKARERELWNSGSAESAQVMGVCESRVRVDASLVLVPVTQIFIAT